LFGHLKSINHAAFSMKGDRFASCDADGFVKVWDLRAMSELRTIDLGPHAANKISFDPKGDVIAVASNSGNIKLVNLADNTNTMNVRFHHESVQVAIFDKTAEYLIGGGSDGVLRIFQS
jgi:WD40 repeat protein